MKNIFILFFVVSCTSAQMVNHGGKRSAYAPANYKEKGIVKYLNQGADSIIDARREDAFKQMYEACGGKYNIINEYANESGHNTYANNIGGYGVTSSQYVYMEYQCESQGAQAIQAEAPKEEAPKRDCNIFGRLLKSQGC